ncbi:hypothetical protein COCVIDRAFT_80811, partial [Bipolaris victoriae FI3]
YQGCYSDTSNRVLPVLTEAWNMTREKCAAICKDYKYYGLEDHKQCFCGNSFVGHTAKIAENRCNSKCLGSNDMCGGGWALSVY